MKKKKIRLMTALVIFVILIFVWTGIFIYYKKSEPRSMDDILSAKEVLTDRDNAIKFLENVHPMFVDGSDMTKYLKAKENYVNSTQTEMKVRDFMIATSRYYCSLEDGHTRVRWSESEYLDIDYELLDGNYYLKEEGKRTEVYITSINDIPVEIIDTVVDELIPYENEMGKIANRLQLFGGKGTLEFAGADVNSDKVILGLSDGTTRTVSFGGTSLAPEYTWDNYISLDGDVVVVDFNNCECNDQLSDICSRLEDYISEGYTKVIIDARTNPGGDSQACDFLLEAIGMEPPTYGVLIRYSKEAAKARPYKTKEGFSYPIEASQNGKKNDKVKLVVLCDKDTFSSATMLLVYVRDGELGTIIGEPSSNKPNNYGDVIRNELKHSHINTIVSHKKFVRPDADNDEVMLMPDVVTSAEDAYSAALEFLQ